MAKNLSDRTKKNLLDLQFNKYLQYYNTSIILLFTYIIGISIALITKQIDYRNPRQIVLVILVSMIFIGIIIALMFKSRENLSEILKKIEKLKL